MDNPMPLYITIRGQLIIQKNFGGLCQQLREPFTWINLVILARFRAIELHKAPKTRTRTALVWIFSHHNKIGSTYENEAQECSSKLTWNSGFGFHVAELLALMTWGWRWRIAAFATLTGIKSAMTGIHQAIPWSLGEFNSSKIININNPLTHEFLIVDINNYISTKIDYWPSIWCTNFHHT